MTQANISGPRILHQGRQALHRRQQILPQIHSSTAFRHVSHTRLFATDTLHSKYLSEPTFRLLVSQINAFRMGLPPHLRRPTHNMGSSTALDGELVAALMVAHGFVNATMGQR